MSAFNSPIWPVHKKDGTWRMTVNYRNLNRVTPILTVAVPDMVSIMERFVMQLSLQKEIGLRLLTFQNSLHYWDVELESSEDPVLQMGLVLKHRL
ncbi:unnamed protein product [Caretta caretta]